MTWWWQKRPNHEKLKPFRIPIQTRNVDTGLRIKTNDIIGSLSYIMNIFLINTSAEPTEFSSRWRLLLRREKPNSAGATIKRWRKSTNISQKFSWVSGYKITTQTTVASFSLTCKKKATPFNKPAFYRPTSWIWFLRHLLYNKNNSKRLRWEHLKPK